MSLSDDPKEIRVFLFNNNYIKKEYIIEKINEIN